MKVVLKSDAEQLDEVMVVAYGTAKKSSFTGSASNIDGKKLELRPITGKNWSSDLSRMYLKAWKGKRLAC